MSDKLAIAYSIRKRMKKMADGGPVDPDSNTGRAFASIRSAFGNPDPKKDDKDKKKPPGYAAGGTVASMEGGGYENAPDAADQDKYYGKYFDEVSSEPAQKEGSSIGKILTGFSNGMKGGGGTSAFDKFAKMSMGGIAKSIRAQTQGSLQKALDEYSEEDREPNPHYEAEDSIDPEEREDDASRIKKRIAKRFG